MKPIAQARALPRSTYWIAATLALLLSLPLAARAAVEVGKPAPDFTAIDTQGISHKLSDFRGKTVILEWTNHECPFVVKHYATDNMQTLQRETTAEGIVWLSIISSAPGKQGYVSPVEADELTQSRKAAPTAVLLDESGDVGRAYGARTTPHMYIIDGDGTLQYMGGIDDRPSTSHGDVSGAKNYVRAALADLAAGKPVAEAVTRPYGCSIKY
jgi:peroxiredoxin